MSCFPSAQNPDMDTLLQTSFEFHEKNAFRMSIFSIFVSYLQTETLVIAFVIKIIIEFCCISYLKLHLEAVNAIL